MNTCRGDDHSFSENAELCDCGRFRGDTQKAAKRDKVNFRYDILCWGFIHAMAQIGHFGAEKYGEFNWQKSGLMGDKSPINHIGNHLKQYIEGESYDHKELGEERKYHLAAIAFNAMMEFWHEEHRDGNTKTD